MTLYRQGKVPGSFYDGFGQEAVSAGPAVGDGRARTASASCTATSPPTSSAASSPRRIFAQYMGREGGITGGRDGNVHFGDRTKGCVGMVSMLPDMMLIATGLAMAFKLRGEQRVRDDLVRRRLDLARRLPRGDELGRRPAAAGHLHPREQPVRVLDPGRPAVRGQPGRARGGLRLPGRDGRRQRRRGDVRGRPRRARARARRRGPDADRGRDHAHARPRRARRHEVRAAARRSRSGGEGPDRPPDQRRSRRSGSTSQALRDEVKAEIDAAVEEALESPMPDGDDGHRRPVRRRAGAARGRQRAVVRLRKKASADADHDLPAGDLRRHARGDARRRARLRDGRGHRDVRRRLQGDRRLHRRVRRRSA